MEKVEIKEMWLVYNFMAVSERPVNAILKDGEVIGYYDEDEYLTKPSEGEAFLVTKEEAEEYVSSKIKEIKETANNIKEILEIVYNDDGNKFNVKNFIPDKMRDGFFYKGQRMNLHIIIDMLSNIIRTRVINIGGRSIPMDSILQVVWGAPGRRRITDVDIVLNNGERFNVTTPLEVDLLLAVFGRARDPHGYLVDEIRF